MLPSLNFPLDKPEYLHEKAVRQPQDPSGGQSYIIDSTGAPVCALLPFSTWAVFFAGLFYAEAGIPELGYGSAIDTFYHIIPFTFYAIAAVIIVPPVRLWPDPQVGANAEGISASEGNRAGLLSGEPGSESG